MRLILYFTFLLLPVYQALAMRVSNVADINGNELIITEIDLSNKGLREFPVQVLACKNLVSLDLSNNGIIRIPAELGQLRNLKSLNFSQNRCLSSADLESVFAAAQFSLDEFTAEDCNLLYLPAMLGEHSDLKKLNVSHNRLTWLPYSFMQLSKLEDVDVSSNHLQNLSWIVNYWWSLKKIDFSDNEDILVSSVLSSLSYFDRLDEITFSKLDFFPKDFSLLNVNKLIVKNSVIDVIPRSEVSTRINQLYLDNCKFLKPNSVVDVLNESVKPGFIHFSNMNASELVAFLQLKADSVTLYKLGALDIAPFKNSKDLKWLDVRGTKIPKQSVDEFVTARPDVELLTKEPIRADFGVHPPIPDYVSEPVILTTQAGQIQNLELGKSYLEIPADGIVDKNGDVYRGEMNLSYREFTTPAEILLSGITMTAMEGEEPLMFSSGGMIELKATDSNGDELFVNPEQPIQVEMFTESTNEDMEMFLLDENGSWQKTGNDSIAQPYIFKELKQDSLMKSDFINKVNAQVVFNNHRYFPVVKKNRKMNSFEITFRKYRTWNLVKGVRAGTASIEVFNPDLTSDYLTTRRFIFEGSDADTLFEKLDSISKYCQAQYKRLRMKDGNKNLYTRFGPNFISGLGVMPDFENDCYKLAFKFKDEQFTLPVTLLSNEIESAGMLQENETFFKRYAFEWKKERRYENSNSRKLATIVNKKVNTLMKAEELERKKALEINFMRKPFYRAQQVGQIAAASVAVLFSVATFGIINADARVRMVQPDPISTEFVSDALDKIKDKPEDIYVIDHRINGVVQYENGDKVYCDKNSTSTVLVFFASGLVGIYHSWKNVRSDKITEVELFDPEENDRETFVKKICYDY